MDALWYGIVAVMLSIYVVLDGFDFGAGILHLFVATTNEDNFLAPSALSGMATKYGC